jgi:hypothetical protein
LGLGGPSKLPPPQQLKKEKLPKYLLSKLLQKPTISFNFYFIVSEIGWGDPHQN